MKNQPAFPTARVTINGVDEQDGIQTFSGGMTLLQYAAIKLKVPNSGNEELDAMIRESLRNDFAAKAMLARGFTVRPYDTTHETAKDCYAMADAMMKAREA
jgi:hypothetical protein